MSRFFPSRRGLYLRYHTAKRMQLRQLTGIGTRKARELLVPRLPIDFDRRYERRIPDDPSVQIDPLIENATILREALDETTREQFRVRAREAADGTPTFLNRTLRVVDRDGVRWYDERFDELPLLWALKLYSFQPLQWLCAGFDPGSETAPELRSTFDRWIRDWIDSVAIGRSRYLRRAWTPWAVSLRILHLSRYLAWRGGCNGPAGEEFERDLRREIYKNGLFLANHIEFDVGGNHLIENGAAMIVAGVLFGRSDWRKTGERVLARTAEDQFLDDGYHFERSPMYHVITVTRYLTVCHLLETSGYPVPEDLRTTAQAGSTFLGYLRPPNGRIPLLNDSVYEEALPLDDCLRYGATLGFEATIDHWDSPAGDTRPEETSGYHWLRTDDGAMLVDGGAIGPPHLPGHSHSDTLSLLLWLDDQPVITDTGTFEYVAGSRREYARGVRGHNTVQVDETEPIALGGNYLMGSRPDPNTHFESGEITVFEGSYEANPYGSDSYTHYRGVYAGDDWWFLNDTVRGHGSRAVRGRFHLHPDIEPTLESSGRVRLALGNGSGEAFCVPAGGTRISITKGRYFPRFGESESRNVLELSARGEHECPVRLQAFLTRRQFEPASVSTTIAGETLTDLGVRTTTYRLPNSVLEPLVRFNR